MPGRPRTPDRFAPEAFVYHRYRYPDGQWLHPRGYDAQRQHTEYVARKGVCAACPLAHPSANCQVSQRHALALRMFLRRARKRNGPRPSLKAMARQARGAKGTGGLPAQGA